MSSLSLRKGNAAKFRMSYGTEGQMSISFPSQVCELLPQLPKISFETQTAFDVSKNVIRTYIYIYPICIIFMIYTVLF